jgi:hypothetical protein
MIGKTLAHYQITNQIGKGGMGEVYQAKNQLPAPAFCCRLEEFESSAHVGF